MTEEQLSAVYNALILFGSGLFGYLGILLSRRAAAPPPKSPAQGDTVQIAGAIIDSRKANEIVEAALHHTRSMEANTRALEANTRTAEDFKDDIVGIRGEISHLAREVVELRHAFRSRTDQR